MRVREFFSKFRAKILSYNEFLPEENEYDDDDNSSNKSQKQQELLKEQLYSTRLYIVLLNVILLLVILFTVFNPQTYINTINNPSFSIYKRLFDQHSNTLSCPCSTITVTYQSFVSTNYSRHPLCTFVNEEWILAFYVNNHSSFRSTDFRAVASAQFEIIRQLCLITQQIITDEILTSLNRTYLISSNVLAENEVFASVNATSELLRLNAPLRLLRILSLVNFTMKSNRFVFSLRTSYDLIMGSAYLSMIQLNENSTKICDCITETCTVKTDIGFINQTNGVFQYSLLVYTPSLIEENKRVPGFIGSCIPLHAVMMADFTCLYNETCLDLLFRYFPHLTQELLYNALSMISRINEKKTLAELVEQLFIFNWSVSINHNQYFDQCSPKSCSYPYEDNTNVLYALTKLLSLYGGLTMVLRFIIPLIVRKVMRRRRRHHSSQQSKDVVQPGPNVFKRIKLTFIKLNLFKTVDRDVIAVHQQRWTTRVYLIVLFGCLFIALIFFSTRKQTMIISVQSPSYDTYQSLLLKSNTLSCSCSQISITYGKLISFSPSFHQVCNSLFTTDIWLTWLTKNVLAFGPFIFDWRSASTSSFRILSRICLLSNSTVMDAIDQFEGQIFVSSHLVEENIFLGNWNTTINEFIYSTETSFGQTIDILRMLNNIDQPLSERGINGLSLRYVDNQYRFGFDGPTDPIDTNGCSCALVPQCQLAIKLWSNPLASSWPYLISTAPGFVLGCFQIESLFLSNLGCLYSNNSQCFSTLINLTSTNYLLPEGDIVKPLNSSLSTRFSQTDLISTIVYKLMVEQWSPNISYRKYFDICSPKECKYQQTTRSNIVDIITTLISIFGGLSIILRLIMPHIIRLFFNRRNLCKRTPTIQNNDNTEGRPSLHIRIQNFFSSSIKSVQTNIKNLNIFPLRSFGNVDREVAKRLGQFSTRLYLLLLIVSFTTFGLYTFIRPHSISETIENPSLSVYQQLLLRSPNNPSAVDCSCSTVSITYKTFLQIDPLFHQICSSNFASPVWQSTFTRSINLNSYPTQNYRRFILTHLELLSDLCRISINHVNDAILAFLSSNFVTARLLSEDVFDIQLNAIINQAQISIPLSIVRQLTIIRTMTHGNGVVSLYGTNYEYYYTGNSLYLTQPVIYNNSCSCDLQMNCISSTMFKGLHMGCLPSESLFLSTLECFYDNDCLTLWKSELANASKKLVNITTLNSSLPSQYSWDTTTVDDLFKHLFVEIWQASSNYTSYFDQCLPSQCIYTYVQRNNLVYSITALLGLSGGLTVVLKWWCPMLIRIGFKVCRRRQNNAIVPNSHE